MNIEKKIESKLFVYIDTLSGDVVGSFYSRDRLQAKRFLMSLCFDALERSHFNIGALAVFIQREVWLVDLNLMTKSLFVKMDDLIDEAVATLDDPKKVIKIKKEVNLVDNTKN